MLTIIIRERMQKLTENVLGDSQNDFRKGRPTIDAIHIGGQIMEKSYPHAFDQLKINELKKDQRT